MENRRGYRQTGFKSRLVQLASVLRTEQIRIGSGVCKYGFDLGTGAQISIRALRSPSKPKLESSVRSIIRGTPNFHSTDSLSSNHSVISPSSLMRDKYFPKDSFSRSRRAAKCLSRVSRLTCVIRLRGKLRQNRTSSLSSSFPDTNTFETIFPLDNPPLNKGDFEEF